MREPISLTLRFKVLRRDRFTCVYCGAHPPHAVLVVDHAQAVADGGPSTEENLVTACEPCNQGKGGRTVVPPRRTKTLAGLVRDQVYDALLHEYYDPLLNGEFADAYGGRGFRLDAVTLEELIDEVDMLVAGLTRA